MTGKTLRKRRREGIMNERRAVERLVERLYKDRLERTGKLPESKEVREMEKKAAKIASLTDNKARK